MNPSPADRPTYPVIDFLNSAKPLTRSLRSNALTPFNSDTSFSIRLREWVISWGGLLIVVLVSFLSRIPVLGRLSLNLDEGFTLLYSRQSWSAVSGFDGYYSPHPPLFFLLVKLSDLIFVETIAARVVTAVFGIGAIVAFYLLVTRLFDKRVAFAASIVIILSPIHLFYSRTGKMYVPVSFFIALTYLSFVAFIQTRQKRWAILYSIALIGSVWIDYSAAYALLPHFIVLAYAIWKLRRESLPLLVAAVSAGLCFVPWLPQLKSTIDNLSANPDQANRSTFVPSFAGLEQAIATLTGFDGFGTPCCIGTLPMWDRWSDAHLIMFGSMVVIAIIGIVIAGRSLGCAVSLLLFGGTIAASTLVSLISPGFETRTVLTSTLGWAILASVAFVNKPVPIALRSAGIAGWLLVVIASSLGVPSVFEYGARNSWTEAAEDLRIQSHLGKPILFFSYGGIVTDLIDVYADDLDTTNRVITLMDGRTERTRGGEHWLDRGLEARQVDAGELEHLLSPLNPENDAVWLIAKFGGPQVRVELLRLGYRKVSDIRHQGLVLELYARDGAQLGRLIEIDGKPGPFDNQWSGWSIPGESIVRDTGTQDSENQSDIVDLSGDDRVGMAKWSYPTAVPGLYTIRVRMSVDSPATKVFVKLNCKSIDGARLIRSEYEYSDLKNGTRTMNIQTAALCPIGTTSLDVIIGRVGMGGAFLHEAELMESPSVFTENQ